MCANVTVKTPEFQQNRSKSEGGKKTIAHCPPKWLVNNKIQSFCKRLIHFPNEGKITPRPISNRKRMIMSKSNQNQAVMEVQSKLTGQ
jgi:hypothetical protein